MLDRLASLCADRRGVTAVEYGLILGLIVIVIFVAMHNVADATLDIWNNVATEVLRA